MQKGADGSIIEASMLGACAAEDSRKVQAMLTAMAVVPPVAFKRREIGLIAGSGRDETRLYLHQDLLSVRTPVAWCCGRGAQMCGRQCT